MILPYQKGDGSLIDAVEGGQWDESIAEHSVALSFWEGATIKACGGMKFISEDDITLWMRIDKDRPKKMFKFFKEMRFAMEVAIEELGYPDLTTVVRCGFRKGERLVKIFGFIDTGTILKQNDIKYKEYRWLKWL